MKFNFASSSGGAPVAFRVASFVANSSDNFTLKDSTCSILLSSLLLRVTNALFS